MGEAGPPISGDGGREAVVALRPTADRDGSRIAVDGVGRRTTFSDAMFDALARRKPSSTNCAWYLCGAGFGYKLEGGGTSELFERGRAKNMYIGAMWRGGVAEVDLPGGATGMPPTSRAR